MTEWKEYKLGEICSRLSSGKSIKSDSIYTQGEYPVWGGNGIRGYTNTKNFSGRCCIIGRQGAYCGNVHFFDGDAYMTEHAIVAVGNDLADSYFLACQLSLMHLENLSAQSAQPGISVKTLSTQTICLPSIEEQKRIVGILTSLDDKIDLLRRENATLEAMAETLFRQWFVVEAKEEWEEGKLGDLIEVKYGKDHKKLSEGKIPVIGSGGVMRYADKCLYNKESVLIPRKGSLNNVMYINEPFWTVDTMFYTEMRRPNIAKYVYHFVKGQDLANMNVGSAVPSMTTEVLNNIPVDIPPQEVFDRFENAVASLYNKKEQNNKQIQSLIQTSDGLLPRLMGGEIKI